MAKITYDDKEIYVDGSTNSQYFRYQDANEIKNVVNANDTRLEHLYELLSQETTQTGTELTINNSFADNMKLDLKGNTEQYSTTGKNLIDTSNFTTIEQRGLTITMNNDGTFNIVGRSTSRGIIDIGNNFADKLVNGHTYAEFCTDYSDILNLHGNLTYKKPDQSLRIVSFSPNQNVTINTSVNTLESAKLSLWVNAVGVDYDYHNLKVIIGEGSSLTENDWEPFTNGASPNPEYPQQVEIVTGNNTITITNSDNTESQILPVNLGSLELCKIGTYQDYLYKDFTANKWYKYKTIEKYTFDGTIQPSDIYTSSSSDKVFAYRSLIKDYLRNNTNICYCTHFISIVNSGYSAVTEGKCCFRFNNGDNNKYFYMSTNAYSTIEEFASWLATEYANGTPVKVYYKLATPISIEITDTTLKEQLNNILTAQSYDYQTNITQTNAVLPFIITATARVERS